MNERIYELARTIEAYAAVNNVYPEHTVKLLLEEILKPSLTVESDEKEYFTGGHCANGGCI